MGADGRWRGWKGSGLKARHCSEKELWGKGKLVKTRPAVPILNLFIWCCLYSHTDETGRTVTCKHCSLFACCRVWFTFRHVLLKACQAKDRIAARRLHLGAARGQKRRSFGPGSQILQAAGRCRGPGTAQNAASTSTGKPLRLPFAAPCRWRVGTSKNAVFCGTKCTCPW